ncbi:MAG: PEP-CTERM sorting domain-containing protein [bacterium]|nr:PEP-CTERM sorting domain-containing protein [bacterium]
MLSFKRVLLIGALTLGAASMTTDVARATVIDLNDQRGSSGDFTFSSPTDGPLGASGISLAFSAGIFDSGNPGDNQGAYALDAAEDYFFVSGSNGSGTTETIILSGLTASAYDFTLYASRAGNSTQQGQIADYTIHGLFSDGGESDDFEAFADGFSAGTEMLFSNVSPIAGTITISITTNPGDPFPTLDGGSAISGLDNYHGLISAIAFTPVPEPGTGSLLLLGLGVLTAAARARK